MDPLYILENLHKVKPAFQPIVSAVKHTVIGYEVLGRIYHNEEWLSLGEFFHDGEVPDDFKSEVDGHLLRLAITKMLETSHEGYLFINRNARQLLIDGGENFLEPLKEFEPLGFPMSRIVLEITEHDFDEDFDVLNHLLLYYKTYGIQIAVDHVGAKSSNIDRIRQLRPHILKIDTGIIRSHNPEVFQDIIYTLSVLARRIGARFSYENIEDDHQLSFAWKHGGHYYQGYQLAKPDFSLLSNTDLSINIGDKVKGFTHREKSRISGRLAFALSCEEKVRKQLNHWQGPEEIDSFIEAMTSSFHDLSFRMYCCNSDGKQISSNFRKPQEQWEVDPHAVGSHWAFRPYFLENMMQMQTWNKGRLSETYSDIETGEMVRTFSYPLSDQYFLFIDISYSFISENDFLLF